MALTTKSPLFYQKALPVSQICIRTLTNKKLLKSSCQDEHNFTGRHCTTGVTQVTHHQQDTRRWLHFKRESHGSGTSQTKPVNERERNRTVTSYYNQQIIDQAARKSSVRLTPSTIMYSSLTADSNHDVMRSAQYLHRELPIRIAHRIAGFRSLPFIVGCNPTILSVHELYIRAFHILNDFPEIYTREDVDKFSAVIRSLMNDHKDVVTDLGQGFKECRKYIQDEDLIRRFLDKNLTSRLGMRMLVTHHLHLHDNKGGHVGVINLGMSLKEIVQQWSSFVTEITENKYGHCPILKISGHTNAVFPYIEMPLDYILPELLKNAVRATIESHPNQKGSSLPPVHIILASNSQDFIVKVSDRGGGVPHSILENVLTYNFSTADQQNSNGLLEHGIFDDMMEAVNRTTSGPMHGYGFGLPTSRAYAEYLGGSLQLQSMQGLGTDVFLRLKHLESKDHELRI